MRDNDNFNINEIDKDPYIINQINKATGDLFLNMLFDNFHEIDLGFGNLDSTIDNKYNQVNYGSYYAKIYWLFMVDCLIDMITSDKRIFLYGKKYPTFFDYEVIEGKRLEIYRQRGFFKDVDLLASNFKIYILKLVVFNLDGTKTERTFSDYKLNCMLRDKTNTGYTRFGTKDFSIKEYYSELHKRFRFVFTPHELTLLVNHGHRNLIKYIRAGFDVKALYYDDLGKLNMSMLIDKERYSSRVKLPLKKAVKVFRERAKKGYIRLNDSGTYFFALSHYQHNKYVDSRGRIRLKPKTKITIYRFIDEIKLIHNANYIYKVKMGKHYKGAYTYQILFRDFDFNKNSKFLFRRYHIEKNKLKNKY